MKKWPPVALGTLPAPLPHQKRAFLLMVPAKVPGLGCTTISEPITEAQERKGPDWINQDELWTLETGGGAGGVSPPPQPYGLRIGEGEMLSKAKLGAAASRKLGGGCGAGTDRCSLQGGWVNPDCGEGRTGGREAIPGTWASPRGTMPGTSLCPHSPSPVSRTAASSMPSRRSGPST